MYGNPNRSGHGMLLRFRPPLTVRRAHRLHQVGASFFAHLLPPGIFTTASLLNALAICPSSVAPSPTAHSTESIRSEYSAALASPSFSSSSLLLRKRPSRSEERRVGKEGRSR